MTPTPPSNPPPPHFPPAPNSPAPSAAPAALDPNIYGLLAEFGDATHLAAGARTARDAGYRRMDAYTPFPVHGLAEALGARETRLGWLVLLGGLIGCSGGFFLQYWTATHVYPIVVGGKPYNSWPAFMVITFELTILIAGLTAVVGMIALNGLPRLHHPLFNVPDFELASRTHFFLCIERKDPRFDLQETTAFLQRTGATRVIVVPYEVLTAAASPATPPPPEQIRHGQGPSAPPAASGMRPFILFLGALLLVGCDNVNRGMDDEARIEPYEPSEFFIDNQSVRPLVPGTVAWGEARLDEHLYAGTVDGLPAATFPFPITAEVLARGRQQYDIYCAVCHNATGDGQGMIVLRGFVPPPSLHIDRLREAPVGHFFGVITNGWGAMYSYNDRVSVENRWAIAAYIRALQLSQSAPEDLLTAEERSRAGQGAPLPAPAGAGSAPDQNAGSGGVSP